MKAISLAPSVHQTAREISGQINRPPLSFDGFGTHYHYLTDVISSFLVEIRGSLQLRPTPIPNPDITCLRFLKKAQIGDFVSIVSRVYCYPLGRGAICHVRIINEL